MESHTGERGGGTSSGSACTGGGGPPATRRLCGFEFALGGGEGGGGAFGSGGMGSSEGADGGIGVDCSVGTIVWVRRRNGSWWPGKILGQHELSASHLMSPRSGTPVKLLGREDASVDWYNLEKSKRVKAFRCGEFNACIERAEAAQGAPIKKREKYARREDAILHALELEKQQIEKVQQKLGNNFNNPSRNHFGSLKKELNNNSSLELHQMNNEFMDHGKSVNSKPLSHLRMPTEEMSGSNPFHGEKDINGKEMNWEDDNSEAMPRMRGLQDFGLRIAPSKRKASSSLMFESAEHSLIENQDDIFPDSLHGMGSVNSVGNGKSSAVKRKRSHGGLVEESLVKRRDRRRPLVQVLKSSAKLSVMQSLQANCESSFIQAQEEKDQIGMMCRAKRSRCTYLPADSSDYLDHTGYSSDQMQMLPTQFVYTNGLHELGSVPGEDTSSGLLREGGTSSSDGDPMDADMEEDTILLQGDKLRHVGDGASEDQETLRKITNESGLLSDCNANILSNDEAVGTADVGVSKWHMKGKRNIRNLTRRTMDVLDGKVSVMISDNFNGSLDGIGYKKKQSVFKMGWERTSGQGFFDKDEELNFSNEDEILEKKIDKKLVGFVKQRYPLMLKSASREHAIGGISYSDEDSHEMFSSGWEADEPCHLNRSAYWGESDDCADTPFGCPLNVEKNLPLIDVELKVQASYQGEHRVPRTDLTPALEGEEAEHDLDGKALFKEPYSAPSHHTSSMKKNSHHRQQTTGKSHKKHLKKGNSSSQKTRTLSSLVTEHKRTGMSPSAKHGRKNGGILGGLIKPGSAVPLIACVPVKVLFSRILEAVGRPPPSGMAHRGLPTGLAERNPP
ncbi:hypothetical protein Taro_032878 [Colocasia esculenta]|uniref:PWWP domain-containing protein n=1 Tax=Colocasia esculenta TaxID=4460 RepID=A0A843W349_COLES|nr:hypothetical protein [Colocasia esculenta]